MSCTLILLSARTDEESVSHRNSLIWDNIGYLVRWAEEGSTLQRDKMDEWYL